MLRTFKMKINENKTKTYAWKPQNIEADYLDYLDNHILE